MHVSSSMRVVAAPGVTVRMVGGQAVLLNAKTRTAFGLDPVGTRMWMVLNGAVSIQAAIESLLAEYDVSEDQLRKDMNELIENLQQHGLIEIHPGE
jgi:Coenzyme PQQ synthesis protein D (PqqD)